MHLCWFQRDTEVYQERKIPLLPLHHLYILHKRRWANTQQQEIIKRKISVTIILSKLDGVRSERHTREQIGRAYGMMRKRKLIVHTAVFTYCSTYCGSSHLLRTPSPQSTWAFHFKKLSIFKIIKFPERQIQESKPDQKPFRTFFFFPN